MNRRDVIVAGAALAAISESARAQTGHDDHGGHGDHAAVSPVFATANKCIDEGNVCIAHCLETFAAGDTDLALCARSVEQLLSVCETLAKLASLRSSYLPAMAKIALTVCRDCETECRKHEQHAPCKACAEACAACAAECQKIAA
jgi:Cys-rich four helix bundle protein (predicted Tat secretion target)